MLACSAAAIDTAVDAVDAVDVVAVVAAGKPYTIENRPRGIDVPAVSEMLGTAEVPFAAVTRALDTAVAATGMMGVEADKPDWRLPGKD